MLKTPMDNTLSFRIGKVAASHAEFAGSIPAEARLIYTLHDSLIGVLLMRVWGATRRLDLPSLAPLSVAGCSRLQLGVPHWATSVDYCK